ncbi:MAG: hypothetical protein ACK5TM_09815, partial [Methylobacterium sp.]
ERLAITGIFASPGDSVTARARSLRKSSGAYANLRFPAGLRRRQENIYHNKAAFPDRLAALFAGRE